MKTKLLLATLLAAPALAAIPPPTFDHYEIILTRKPFGELTAPIRVGAWPVKFIPTFDPLTRDAVAGAETADYEGVPFRVVSAAHLAVIALSVGRAKDFTRILALLESAAVTRAELGALAAQYNLAAPCSPLRTEIPRCLTPNSFPNVRPSGSAAARRSAGRKKSARPNAFARACPH